MNKQLRQSIKSIERAREEILAIIRQEKLSPKAIDRLTSVSDNLYYTLDTVKVDE